MHHPACNLHTDTNWQHIRELTPTHVTWSNHSPFVLRLTTHRRYTQDFDPVLPCGDPVKLSHLRSAPYSYQETLARTIYRPPTRLSQPHDATHGDIRLDRQLRQSLSGQTSSLRCYAQAIRALPSRNRYSPALVLHDDEFASEHDCSPQDTAWTIGLTVCNCMNMLS